MITTFRDLIAANKRNSFLLVVIFILFTALVAMVLALGLMVYMDDRAPMRVNVLRSAAIGGIAMVISLLVALVSYFEGDKMVLAVSGAALWSFPVNHFWRASPMTYVFDGKQYIAVASGQSIIAFGLVE